MNTRRLEEAEKKAEKKAALIAHLESQYKMMRDEIRVDKGLVAATPSVLVALLTGELIVAKDKPEALLALPLTILACGGFMGILMSFLTLAAKYAELLESKLNHLLGEEVYLYETRFGGPRNDKRKTIPTVTLSLITATLPLGITGYGIYTIGWGGDHSPIHSHPELVALLLIAIVVVGLFGIVYATLTMVGIAEGKRDDTFELWKNEHAMVNPLAASNNQSSAPRSM